MTAKDWLAGTAGAAALIALIWVCTHVGASFGGSEHVSKPTESVNLVPMATVHTTNAPDGRCHEDMACWQNHK